MLKINKKWFLNTSLESAFHAGSEKVGNAAQKQVLREL